MAREGCMNSKWIITAVVALLVAHGGFGQPRALPHQIRTYLDSTYYGWKFSTVAQDMRDAFFSAPDKDPSFIRGDFNHDGKWDYAVQITCDDSSKSRRVVIAFLATKSGFKPFVVESMREDNEYYITLDPRSAERFDFSANKRFVNPSDGISIGYAGRGGYTYFFRRGAFYRVDTAD